MAGKNQFQTDLPKATVYSLTHLLAYLTYGAFVWNQSGIRIIGIMQVSVRLAALPIPEYLDFHSGYSAPRSRIAGIYSRIYSYSRIFPNERALNYRALSISQNWPAGRVVLNVKWAFSTRFSHKSTLTTYNIYL